MEAEARTVKTVSQRWEAGLGTGASGGNLNLGLEGPGSRGKSPLDQEEPGIENTRSVGVSGTQEQIALGAQPRAWHRLGGQELRHMGP